MLAAGNYEPPLIFEVLLLFRVAVEPFLDPFAPGFAFLRK
jgi:hypothetical protein